MSPIYTTHMSRMDVDALRMFASCLEVGVSSCRAEEWFFEWIKRLSGEENGISEDWSVLKHIRRLLQIEWEVKVCHTYREANRCIDALAHIGCELRSSVIFYKLCPTQITHFFLW
jgi:hypothetical protein